MAKSGFVTSSEYWDTKITSFDERDESGMRIARLHQTLCGGVEGVESVLRLPREDHFHVCSAVSDGVQ